MRKLLKWLVGLAAAFAVLLAFLAVLAAFMGFADIPCQDGIWSEARQTCVPDISPAQ